MTPRIGTELLRLLAQDASVDALDAQAQRHSGDPDLAAARELALQVRAVLDGHRRRAADLAALVDTARDLASADRTGGVLDAIVRRARSLLGTDVAYLTLADADRGDTFMRATAGSVSARFQAVRLPAGAGLGGLVAQTRRPYWTADYPSDDRYAHTADIDGAVDDEGLVAICGTPLLVDDEFVGVLFAANRSRRPFDRDEVALLGSLAALAAVSIVQARRTAERAAALAELSAAHAGIEQAARAHDSFTHVVLSGGGVDDIAAALGELLGCWVVVLDDDGNRIGGHAHEAKAGVNSHEAKAGVSTHEAKAGVTGTAPPVDLAAHAALRRSATTGRLAEAADLAAVAVRASGHRLGTLVLGRTGLDAGQVRTVERAAMVTALVLLFGLRAAEADLRVRSDLLADLVARPAGAVDAGLVERGRLLGLHLRRPHVVVVIRHPGTEPGRALLLAATDAGGGHGLVATSEGATVAVVPGADPAAVAAALGAVAAGEITIGVAGPTVPGAGLREARAEATRTATALAALGLRAGSARELGFAGLIGGSPADVAAFVTERIGPLLRHDADRGTDLVATLEAWFAAGGSPRHASGVLHVHVNTVAQRLDRVSRLLGAGWQTPERALQLQLALHLRRLGGDPQ